MGRPIVTDTAKAVQPRVVDHNHCEGELGLAKIGHVSVPPIFAKVVPLARLNCRRVTCEAATCIDIVTNTAEAMCLPRCAHIFTPFHDTGSTVKCERLVREARQTPVRIWFLGRATASKECATFEVNDLGPVLFESVYRL